MKATQKIRNLPIAVFVWGLGILLIGLVSTIFMTAYRIISSSLMESNIAYTAQVFSQYQDRIRKTPIFSRIWSGTWPITAPPPNM